MGNVEEAVLRGQSIEIQQIRNGLSAQQVVVTDRMDRIRQIDIQNSHTSSHLPPLGKLLFLRESDVTDFNRLPLLRASQLKVREYAFEATLEQSGLGMLDARMTDADRFQEIDGDVRLLIRIATVASKLIPRALKQTSTLAESGCSP